MNDATMGSIIVAVLAFLGTVLGTFGGILTANRLTNYRIQRLEEEVKFHNDFARRVPVIEEIVETHERRITRLEGFK